MERFVRTLWNPLDAGRDRPGRSLIIMPERNGLMPRPISRPLIPLGIAMCLLVAFAPQARARTSDTTSEEHLRRLKVLQQRMLMQEPAERVREGKERWERVRASRKQGARKVGLKQRGRPAAGGGEGEPGRIPEAVLKFRVSRATGATAVENYPVSDPTGEPGGLCQSEVSIASSCNYVVAAWNDGEGTPTFQGFAYSSDGGKTWTDGGSPPTTNVGTWASDPVVVVNPTTRAFYYAGLCDPAPGTNGVGVVRGTFRGGTFRWETPKLVRQYNTSTDVIDKEWLAVDPATGTLYLSYSHFTGGSDQIDFERSTDDNQTWTSLQTLSSAQDAGYVQGSRPAVGPDGEVYVVWWAIGEARRNRPNFNSLYGRDFMRIRKSTNSGASFEPQHVTADSLFSNWGSGAPGFNRATGVTFPSIAVDRSGGPYRGRVYLTWNESIDFYEDDLGLGGKQNEIEINDDPRPQATLFVPGQVLRGLIAYPGRGGGPGDFDYFRFDGTRGQTVILYLDSLDARLDATFRLFCDDANLGTSWATRLAFSGSDGVIPAGSLGLLVFTLPADGTYYLRLASFSGERTGGYRVQTGLHTPRAAPTDDRARDHRDVFVKTSDDGVTWGSTVRANDEPGYFDDWLPEVAVAGDGRAFVAYYDWRDATDCGASSNVYLTRSDDGGGTWTASEKISTAQSHWSVGSSNLVPNQGDYISIFGTDTTVVVAWADFRRGDPDVYAYAPPAGACCTSAGVTVVGVVVAATFDTARVTWNLVNGADSTVTIYRRNESAAVFDSVFSATADASGTVSYTDATVTAGAVYVYRLGLQGFCERFAGDVRVDLRPQLALAVRPNPASQGVQVSFVLESAAPATLELLDITGRRVHSSEVGSFGPGRRIDLTLTDGHNVRAGVYVVRLSQGGKSVTTRVAVIP